MFLKTSQIRQLSFKKTICLGIIASSIVLLPLTGVGFTLPKLTLLSFTAIAICLWLFLYADIAPLSVFLRTGWLGWSLLLFVLSILVSVYTSSIPVLSILGADPRIEGLLTYAVYGSLFLFALCTAVDKEGRSLVLKTILSINIIVIAYGTMQFAGVDPFQNAWDNQAFLHRIFSFLGHPNALGAFIVLTFPIVVLSMLQAKKNARMLYIILLALNGSVLMGTASRSAVIGAAFLGVAYIFLTPESRKNLKKMGSMHKTILVWITLGILIIGYVSFLHRFSLEGMQSRSLRSRSVIWSDTIHMLQARPQGYGLETMGTLYPAFKSAKLLATESLGAGVDRAHSNPLDLLLTIGPIGFGAFYAFLFFLLKSCIVLRKKEPELLACGLGIFGYSIALLFGFQTIVTAMVFWIMAGWILAILWQRKRPKTLCGTWARCSMLCLCVVCICANAVFLRWSVQRVHLARAQQYFAAGRLSDSLGEFHEASQLFVYDRTLLVRFAETALLAAEHSPDGATKDVFLRIADQALAQLSIVTNDHDGMVPLLRAWLSALHRDTASVRGYIAQAEQVMPTTIDTYRIAAHSYRLVGDIVAAMQAEYALKNLLPEYWMDKEGRARLFWKENPWLEEL